MSKDAGAAPETAIREERKVVTALFADLVGSTSLAERLDPEEVKLVVGDAVARIAAEVERLGGRVKDLAGDGVLAFFGAPITSEDDAERAVLAGLAIADALTRYGEEVERAWGVEGFSVRVGIGTGPVVVGALEAGTRTEYAAFGDTVNTAARLQSAATPGSVLVDAATQGAIARLFAWSEPRHLDLKGKGERTVAFEVAAAPIAARKRRGRVEVEAPLVGRERELATARTLLEAVGSGTGGVLFVTGEAGIGKSRLLAELRTGFDGLWLEGRCVSYGESLPYWPFRDLLREWLGVGAEEPELRIRIALRRAIERLHGERAPEIYPYLGAILGVSLESEAAARIANLSPEALQYRTFEVVGELLSQLADHRPVVVALEDLHWADTTSVQLVERLFAVAEQAAVVLAFSLRDERDHPSWEAGELAAREFPHLVQRIELEPLTGDAQHELLNGLIGAGTLPEELERRVLEVAEGNPFFLEELVGSLADAGALAVTDSRWSFDHEVIVEIPPTVERVILSRIDRLSPECHDVLTSASALGRRFSLALLEGVVGTGCGEALHELQRLDLVRVARRWPESEYRFKHALIQEAAYRTLVSERRRNLHRSAAEWLERRHIDNPEEALGVLAHHWLAAEDEAKAIEYLARAGDQARADWALDEAIEHYRGLLRLLERRGEHQEMALVLFKLAVALHNDLRFSDAAETYGRAFEYWSRPAPGPPALATLRIGMPRTPRDPDPSSSIFWNDIQFCMQLFDRLVEAWPERAIVPSLAERWEISDDGLRYVFVLRSGLRWSDGEPLTAHDVEFGVKRTLDPSQPGGAASIYFVLENAEDYHLGREPDPRRVGVRALDERRVEFRLAAPAPYFMSVVNRPDGGPQPRHAIEREGDDWALSDHQVVSGPFRAVREGERLALERRQDYHGVRLGNVERVEYVDVPPDETEAAYGRGEFDVVFIPFLRPLDARFASQVALGPPTSTAFLAFDHHASPTASADFRRALAHAVDRRALAERLPGHVVIATGGIVPPALQGHTPDIVPRFDPEQARAALARSGEPPRVQIAALVPDAPLVEILADTWRSVLGLEVGVETASQSLDPTRPFAAQRFAPVTVTRWLPGYPDPEYYLRLLLHSRSQTNHGGYAHPPFDDLVERARLERNARVRLELFHEADRMAVAEQVALVPLIYAGNTHYVQPWVRGWWELGKSSSSFGDLEVGAGSPRAR